jgi:hypothetical protein
VFGSFGAHPQETFSLGGPGPTSLSKQPSLSSSSSNSSVLPNFRNSIFEPKFNQGGGESHRRTVSENLGMGNTNKTVASFSQLNIAHLDQGVSSFPTIDEQFNLHSGGPCLSSALSTSQSLESRWLSSHCARS